MSIVMLLVLASRKWFLVCVGQLQVFLT